MKSTNSISGGEVCVTYCTHSTARPFCMYSVMHLIS